MKASPLDSGTLSSTTMMEQEAEVTSIEANNTVSKTALTPQEKEILRRQRTRVMGFFCLSLTKMIKSYILNILILHLLGKPLQMYIPQKQLQNVIKFLDKWRNLRTIEDMSISIFMQHEYDLRNDLK